MKVTITNGTAKLLDVAGVKLRAAAGDQAAEQIFDLVKGVGVPNQTLPSGKRQTFTVAFSLPSGLTELRVEVAPTWFGYQPVFFVGEA